MLLPGFAGAQPGATRDSQGPHGWLAALTGPHGTARAGEGRRSIRATAQSSCAQKAGLRGSCRACFVGAEKTHHETIVMAKPTKPPRTRPPLAKALRAAKKTGRPKVAAGAKNATARKGAAVPRRSAAAAPPVVAKRAT